MLSVLTTTFERNDPRSRLSGFLVHTDSVYVKFEGQCHTFRSSSESDGVISQEENIFVTRIQDNYW